MKQEALTSTRSVSGGSSQDNSDVKVELVRFVAVNDGENSE